MRNTFRSYYCKLCHQRFKSSTEKSNHIKICAKRKFDGPVDIHEIDKEEFAACDNLNKKSLSVGVLNKIIDDHCSRNNKEMKCKRCGVFPFLLVLTNRLANRSTTDEVRKHGPSTKSLTSSQRKKLKSPGTELEATSCSIPIIEDYFPLPTQLPATTPSNLPVHHTSNNHDVSAEESLFSFDLCNTTNDILSLVPRSESELYPHTVGESDFFSQIGMTTSLIDPQAFFDISDYFNIAMMDAFCSAPSNEKPTNSNLSESGFSEQPTLVHDGYIGAQFGHFPGPQIAASHGSAMDLDTDVREYNRDLDFEMVTAEELKSNAITQQVASDLDLKSVMAKTSGTFTQGISQPNYNDDRHQLVKNQPRKPPGTPNLKDLLETRDILATKLAQPSSPRVCEPALRSRSASRESLASVQSIRSDYLREWRQDQASELGFKPTEIVPVMECDEGGENDVLNRKESIAEKDVSTKERAEDVHTSLGGKLHCQCQRLGDSKVGKDGFSRSETSNSSTMFVHRLLSLYSTNSLQRL